jgi:hypothetical protein
MWLARLWRVRGAGIFDASLDFRQSSNHSEVDEEECADFYFLARGGSGNPGDLGLEQHKDQGAIQEPGARRARAGVDGDSRLGFAWRPSRDRGAGRSVPAPESTAGTAAQRLPRTRHFSSTWRLSRGLAATLVWQLLPATPALLGSHHTKEQN